MTRILAGGARDSRGVRVCPLGCGPDAAHVASGQRDTTCKKAKRRVTKPGETTFDPPPPRTCRMFYDEKGEPT